FNLSSFTAFINSYVCIKVDPNGIPNGNYTTISLKSQTIQPYTKPAIINRNEADNFTLLGDTELSASERTRRLIPYMAFYVPVSELPINKQYASKNNIHATKQLARPSATGSTGSSFIPLPPQYVHSGMQYLPPAPSAASSAPSGHQHYQGNAGLGSYHTHGFGGQQQPQQQQQFHLLPPPTGHSHIHLQPPGPPGPSAASLPTFTGHGKGNGNNHNAFVTFKEVNPKRQKTVQHFPPLTSTASSPSASSSSYENIRQTSSIIKQQKAHHYGISGGGSSSGTAAVYRPRTKQSKINLTPFTPSNTVPGNFVPIVYTPVNSNNNNILNSHATAAGGEINDSSSYNQDENQQYPKQQHQLQHPRNQPQQIAIEYSSGPLPPSASATLIPIDVQPVPQRHHQQQQQQQHQHNPKQQSQFYSVSNSPVNVDLTHSAVGGGGTIASEDLAHHHQHNNAEAISPPTIYHQNQNQHHQQQPEHVIIDAPLRTLQQSQTVTGIGSQQQQQQQQLYHGGKSATQFQPPKPESFFDSEIQLQQHHNQHQQHQQQQHNIEQVLKDVNAYSSSTKNSQMMTPQEKYVMYLQQRIRYNKHQQRQHAIRHKYREHNTDKEQHYQQQQQNIQPNPSQIFVLSSTMSPPIHVSPGTVTALAPIRPPLPPPSPSHYDPNYPQHSPIHHDLYPRPELKPTASGGVSASATGGSTAAGEEEQILTIPVHSLFGELDTLQQQQHNHYSQSHSVSLPSSHHKSQYSKHGSQKPQYIDYVINEPQQSLDDEQQQHQHQLELLKPTLGPPSHAFILVTTDAPFPNEPVTQENYATSLRPPFKNKSKLRLQPVSKEKNVNYPTIREQSPTGRPHVVSITPTGKSHPYNDEDAKYVYVKEEFGQKLSTAQGGGGVGKLKPSNKYESDDNQIPQQRQQQHHHHHQQQQQQQQHDENMPLQTLATRQPITHHQQHNEVQHNVPVTGIESTPPKTILADPNELPDIRTSSLAEILHKLQESNHLPHTLTPDNIDNSIKTLIRILNNLKQTQTIVANPPQHHEIPAHSHPSSPDYDYTTGSEEEQQQPEPHDLSLLTPTGPNKHPGPSTGRPGIDYPNYAEIPQTSFDCSEQRYKGFFGDPETNCQVWHYCDLNGGKASFLCPNGTIFSQIALTCDWWFNVKCATTAQLYVLNERLYKYILPFTPKFPEDYSGPIVDKYLAMKFQEMEEKMRLEKEKALQEEVEAETETEQPLHNHLDETTTEDNVNRHVKSHPQQTKHESVNSQVSEQSSERNLLIDDEVDDISLRGTVDNFESTTIATMAATLKSEPISYSLKPIIVSSTAGPDYDEEQSHEYEKRDHDKVIKDLEVKKSDTEESLEDDDKNNEGGTEKSVLPPPPTETATSVASSKKMQITVEKVDVIEIKPDEATGHLIRDMLLNSKHKQNK
ncbi:hypothetical protein CVS40_0302, partial [Lucilia cuprina]